jgi:squalene-hopene/tetraprenyl-beta-curcumene cyclase
MPQRICLLSLLSISFATVCADEGHQYAFGDIVVPKATSAEPIRSKFSLSAAIQYIENGAKAWSQERKCVSCHTNGSYLLTRPALSRVLGNPNEEMRAFFVGELKELQAKDVKELRGGIKPTQIAYITAGLAEWDEHVSGNLSRETETALHLMFAVQSEDGSFSNEDCWPPLESSDYHGATVAALAAAAAPGWIADARGDERAGYEKLVGYLTKTLPPHDYGKVLQLWVATEIPDLVTDEKKKQTIKMIRRHQNPDGGWALRRFAAPETWGGGNRAEKLRGEEEFKGTPPSDGHMTGLAVMVLRAAGVPKSDEALQKAVTWLKKNQRESGRWWTRSLNTDRAHFITFSGTCYPLLALQACEALGVPKTDQ